MREWDFPLCVRVGALQFQKRATAQKRFMRYISYIYIFSNLYCKLFERGTGAIIYDIIGF